MLFPLSNLPIFKKKISIDKVILPIRLPACNICWSISLVCVGLFMTLNSLDAKQGGKNTFIELSDGPGLKGKIELCCSLWNQSKIIHTCHSTSQGGNYFGLGHFRLNWKVHCNPQFLLPSLGHWKVSWVLSPVYFFSFSLVFLLWELKPFSKRTYLRRRSIA